MNTEKQLKFFVLILSLSLIGLLINYLKLETKYEKSKVGEHFLYGGDILKAQTIDSLQNLVDSLYNQNYPCQIELNRYEVAYQIFLKRNPSAAQQYGKIISEETE